jgi:hypothetical protein
MRATPDYTGHAGRGDSKTSRVSLRNADIMAGLQTIAPRTANQERSAGTSSHLSGRRTTKKPRALKLTNALQLARETASATDVVDPI